MAGNNFFGKTIKPLESVIGMGCDIILVTSYLKRSQVFKKLTELGVPGSSVRMWVN